ncbi:MAG: multiple sugar transport system substrate-binding protein [Actinomycetota bacterium]|nr:multiple sugar transport system substrate-binding protein [Actinomycetota bacterium]
MPEGQMDDGLSRGISRRRFIQTAAGLTVLAACGKNATKTTTASTVVTDVTSTLVQPATKLSGDLKILQWSHFVPRHDKWIDPFAQDWGRQVGVNVSIDHINQAELPARAAAEIAAGEGHDLIEFIGPPAALEPGVLDLTDLNQEAVKRFGTQVALCTRSTFNPTTNKYFGFCHGWAPDPGDYRRSLWEKVGLPNGPTSYQELLEGGGRIKSEQSIQLGIGMSNEIDSNMAARALIWSYGGSVQDENMNVVLNSPQTIEAVDYMASLYKAAMTEEVFGWGAASNNQGLIAGSLSYILNSISAYRTALTSNPTVAADVFFTSPLRGGATALASEHAILIYVVPKHAKNPDAAKEFILHLVANYAQNTNNSELYDFPAFPSRVPQLDAWLDNDPFGSQPANKLALLKDAESWSTNVGHPGPANAAIGEVFDTFVLPKMMARAARGELSAADAVAEAETEVKKIFAKWRAEGLVGGTS